MLNVAPQIVIVELVILVVVVPVAAVLVVILVIKTNKGLLTISYVPGSLLNALHASAYLNSLNNAVW